MTDTCMTKIWSIGVQICLSQALLLFRSTTSNALSHKYIYTHIYGRLPEKQGWLNCYIYTVQVNVLLAQILNNNKRFETTSKPPLHGIIILVTTLHSVLTSVVPAWGNLFSIV